VRNPVSISFINFFRIATLATGTIISYITYLVAITGVITTVFFKTANTK